MVANKLPDLSSGSVGAPQVARKPLPAVFFRIVNGWMHEKQSYCSTRCANIAEYRGVRVLIVPEAGEAAEVFSTHNYDHMGLLQHGAYERIVLHGKLDAYAPLNQSLYVPLFPAVMVGPYNIAVGHCKATLSIGEFGDDDS
jgi:hypothetical protein